MLKEVIIKNYKAFKQEACLELRPITVLIGRNSSGKSSLCKLVDAISESFRDDAVGFLPIQTEHNRLGDQYEDLFYQRITTDLGIDMRFDGEKHINAHFLMQGGVFCPSSYVAGNGEVEKSKAFSNKEESMRAGFIGLYYPLCCNEVGVTHDDVKYEIEYLGPIRCRAKRRIEGANVRRNNYVGEDGNKAYEMLLLSYLTDGELFGKVSQWCADNMDGQRLAISEAAPGSGVFSLYVDRSGAHVNIADVGEGIAQVLPVIVQSYVKYGDISIIEQPSLHLNSAAHAKVAMRLAESAIELNKKYLIETHSDTFLTGIRKMVVERKLNRKDVIIYSISHDGESAYLAPIEIDDNFEYTSWPEGMFEDDYQLQNEISRIIG